MGLRFRKSVSLGKGMRINFSKSGASMSFGRRSSGFTTTVGKRGTYVNIGIPGTGISYRTKISAPKSRTSMKRTPGKSNGGGANLAASSLPRAVSEWIQYTGDPNPSVTVSLSEEGEFTFKDKDGRTISDDYLIGIIKRTPQFSEQAKVLRETQAIEVANIIKECEAEAASFVDLYKQSAVVMPRCDFENELANLSLQTYEPVPFEIDPPTEADVRSQIEAEADQAIKSLWKAREKKRQYVEAHFESRFAQCVAEWKKMYATHEAEQEALKVDMDARFREEYRSSKEYLEQALSGSPVFIESTSEEWLASIEVPFEIDAQLEYREDSKTLFVDLDLPEIEDLPNEEAIQLKNGDLRMKSKSQKTLRAEYAKCVFGLAVYISSNLLCISPCIAGLTISGYTQRRDSEGNARDDYIYSIAFTRDVFEQTKCSEVDPEEFCMRFENRCSKTKTDIFRVIKPYD